ncbi:MAG: sulfotransferase domain-containing protein [Verrucomicrobiota bacterium]
MPLPEGFLSALQPTDSFLVCFPRSGSRWLRLLLSDIVNQLLDRDPSGLYDTQLEVETGTLRYQSNCLEAKEVIPNGYVDPRELPVELSGLIDPIFKSHNFTQLSSRPSARILYLFRKPENCLFSHYHYLLKKKHPSTLEQTLSEFFLQWFPVWTKHVSAVTLKATPDPSPFALVQYQDEIPFSCQQLRLAARFLHLDYSSGMEKAAFDRFSCFLTTLNQSGEHSYPRCQNIDLSDLLETPALREVWARSRAAFEKASRLATQHLRSDGEERRS